MLSHEHTLCANMLYHPKINLSSGAGFVCSLSHRLFLSERGRSSARKVKFALDPLHANIR
jgi:hypothetical protein